MPIRLSMLLVAAGLALASSCPAAPAEHVLVLTHDTDDAKVMAQIAAAVTHGAIAGATTQTDAAVRDRMPAPTPYTTDSKGNQVGKYFCGCAVPSRAEIAPLLDWMQGGSLRAQAIPAPPPPPPVLVPRPPAPAWQSQLLAFVPIVAPLVIALLKSLLQWLPGWSLPILCTSLGVLATWLTSGSLSQESALAGAVLGGAGVAVREVVDQLKQKLGVPPNGGGPAPLTPVLAGLLLVGLLIVGCANVGNRAQDVTTTVTTTPTNTVTVTRSRSVESSVNAVGDAKQAISAMSARNTTTTQSIGTEGVTQESSLAGLVEILKMVFEQGKESGRKVATGGL